jgi:hypothetical protein
LPRRSLGDVQVLHELLGDGPTALANGERLQILPGRASDTGEVRAVVLVETPVLHSDDSLREVLAELVLADRATVLLRLNSLIRLPATS